MPAPTTPPPDSEFFQEWSVRWRTLDHPSFSQRRFRFEDEARAYAAEKARQAEVSSLTIAQRFITRWVPETVEVPE